MHEGAYTDTRTYNQSEIDNFHMSRSSRHILLILAPKSLSQSRYLSSSVRGYCGELGPVARLLMSVWSELPQEYERYDLRFRALGRDLSAADHLISVQKLESVRQDLRAHVTPTWSL